MSTLWLRASALIAVGVLLGWSLARILEPLPQVRPAAGPQPSAGAEAPGAVASRADVPARPAAERAVSLAEITAIDGEFAQTLALYRLAADTDGPSLEALIRDAEALPGGVDRRAALSILYTRYAELAAETALEFLLESGSRHTDVGLRSIFHVWSRADLDAALAAAAALEPRWREVAARALLTAREDLAVARKRAIAGDLGVERMLPGILSRQQVDSAPADPAAAWRQALAAGDERGAAPALSGIASEWARKDPLGAVDAAMQLADHGLRDQLLHAIVGQWSGRAPQQAMDWIMARSPEQTRGRLASIALEQMAAASPQQALNLAYGLPEPARRHGVTAVLTTWAASDPVDAANLLPTLTEPRLRQVLLERLAMHMGATDEPATLDWLGTLQGDEARMAGRLAFFPLSRHDPARASTLLDRLPPDARDGAVQAVASAWADRDPPAAARWIATVADADNGRALGRSLGSAWKQSDPDAAYAYARALPAGGLRDGMLLSMLMGRGLAPEEVDGAFAAMRSPSARQMAAQMLQARFRRSDPERAERYRRVALEALRQD